MSLGKGPVDHTDMLPSYLQRYYHAKEEENGYCVGVRISCTTFPYVMSPEKKSLEFWGSCAGHGKMPVSQGDTQFSGKEVLKKSRYLHLYPGRSWLQQYFCQGARFIFHAPPLSDKSSMREAINGVHTFEQLAPDFWEICNALVLSAETKCMRLKNPQKI